VSAPDAPASDVTDFDPLAVPIRHAATVMVVRDGHDGLEVFMVRRSMGAVFVGGGYVFPGGRVDDADAHADYEPVCSGLADGDASMLLRLDTNGLSYWVAAIREVFEEAGVLFAYRHDGTLIRFDDGDVEDRFASYRRELHRGTLSLVEMCRREQLVLAVDRLEYFAHWITPLGSPRRFDTRFFVAHAPLAQTPLHDDRETIDSVWVRPHDALNHLADGAWHMITPTIRNLENLARFPTASALVDAAAAARRHGAPDMVIDDEGLRIALPFDAV
jgi:8-oxo-dGTP pyrophosphatase MutT (NUDIX family)